MFVGACAGTNSFINLIWIENRQITIKVDVIIIIIISAIIIIEDIWRTLDSLLVWGSELLRLKFLKPNRRGDKKGVLFSLFFRAFQISS